MEPPHLLIVETMGDFGDGVHGGSPAAVFLFKGKWGLPLRQAIFSSGHSREKRAKAGNDEALLPLERRSRATSTG
jgi:hypothetical protein